MKKLFAAISLAALVATSACSSGSSDDASGSDDQASGAAQAQTDGRETNTDESTNETNEQGSSEDGEFIAPPPAHLQAILDQTEEKEIPKVAVKLSGAHDFVESPTPIDLVEFMELDDVAFPLDHNNQPDSRDMAQHIEEANELHKEIGGASIIFTRKSDPQSEAEFYIDEEIDASKSIADHFKIQLEPFASVGLPLGETTYDKVYEKIPELYGKPTTVFKWERKQGLSDIGISSNALSIGAFYERDDYAVLFFGDGTMYARSQEDLSPGVEYGSFEMYYLRGDAIEIEKNYFRENDYEEIS